MKKIFTIIILTFALIFTSCEKEELLEQPNPNSTEQVKCQVKCYTCYHTGTISSVVYSQTGPMTIYDYFNWETQFCGTKDDVEEYENKQWEDKPGVHSCDCIEN